MMNQSVAEKRLASLIPPVREWNLQEACWIEEGAILESYKNQYKKMLISPSFTLEGGRTYKFKLSLNILDEGGVSFAILDRKNYKIPQQKYLQGDGCLESLLEITVKEPGLFQLVLTNYQKNRVACTRVKDISISVESEEYLVYQFPKVDTFLPHWSYLEQSIHSLCKRSRFWNTIVAAIEMRLGREEVLSLPQYMALCPTGQCNALCGFCSVTTSRTGIIKKQLSFERLERFLAPVSKTIRVYGLEGNGEPTLYDRFDDLVKVLTSDGATFYLITNGERLKSQQIELLLKYSDSINFSLNAATAQTHQRVMKLKHFDTVIDNIKQLVSGRGSYKYPKISVSYVVNHDNIHEVQKFIDFAENELQVDFVLVRPLSEIANEQGTVEDLRPLVPYESDIKDMIDSVQDYLEDTPRRANVQVYPETFKAYQPDPLDRIIMPLGFEGRLLPPHRRDWLSMHPQLQVAWLLNCAKLACPPNAESGMLWTSVPIPVESERSLKFRCLIRLAGSPITLSITDIDANELASQEISPNSNDWQDIEMIVETEGREYLRIACRYNGGMLNAELDFERLRTPSNGLRREFKLPHSRRWEVASPDARVEWNQNRVRVGWSGSPWLYLLKSYSIPCQPHQTLSLPITVQVNSGALGIGILSEDFQHWTNTFAFTEGNHETTVSINTQNNHRLQVVLYSQAEKPLDAEVNWLDGLEMPPKRTLAAAPPQQSVELESAKVSKDNVAVQSAPGEDSPQLSDQSSGKRITAWLGRKGAIAQWWRQLLFGKVKIYCQKPWTDLHNFTVDGRMDVCCIATGASQQRYALGNLFTQDFQQVWNGESAREFRRTVNSDKPLPPCQRCPMAYAYQGPLFSPTNIETIRSILWDKVGGLPGGKLWHALVFFPIYWFFNLVVFRGFKR
jgi:radical SAM protein with 4Fe4S-binding SPASM domain